MIYVVIPVHNRLQATRECLDSLRCQTYPHFKIVIVDDGSCDGTSAYVKKEYPEVTVLMGDGNLWWTGATNMGVRYSLEHAQKDDDILTLNNDTILPSEYLATVVALSKQRPEALIGSIALDEDHRDTIVDAGTRIDWRSAKFTALKTPPDDKRDAFYTVSVLPGRGTLIPICVFHKIGLYDAENFPHYAADYDFSLRAHKAGYSLVLHPRCYLYSKTRLTGISNVHNKISLGAWLRGFNSIKSPNNLKVRLRFGLRHAPLRCRLSFTLCDFLRVILGTFRNQIRHMVRRT